MATTDITTLDPSSNYFIVKNQVFSPIEIINSDDPSEYVGEGFTDSDLNQHETFKLFLQNEISDDKLLYLNIYQQLIKSFIRAGNNSVFLRQRSSITNYSGLDIFKTINFLDFLDIQQLKDSVLNNLSNDPCILLDSKPKQTIHPLKQQFLKTNFITLCRLHIGYLKICNLYLSTVFDNSEFYNKDTTFINFAFTTFKQQMSRLIPDYYNSIKVFLYDELNDLLEAGTELIDDLTKEKYEFIFPLNDDNLETNVDKYLNYLFNKQHKFVSNKYNAAFNQTILDADEITNFPLYPSNNINQKLYSVQDYMFDNLTIFTNTPTTFDLNTVVLGLNSIRNEYIFLLLDITDSDLDDTTKSRTYKLSLNLTRIFDSKPMELKDLSVTVVKVIDKELDFPSTGSEEISNILLELKPLFLALDPLKTFINYCFPINKILNIASFFYIQTNMKFYENLSKAVDGSIKAVDTINNIILGNEDKIDCELPEDPLSLDNPILGINLEVAKMIAQAPIQILKGLEETYDPNIAIASKLRDLSVAAGLPPTPVALWSLALLPALTIPPPVGVGPPLISPWGYIYWGVDAGEVLTAYAKDGFNTKSDSKIKAKITISDNPFKNKNC
jgi:hypothetical protein